VAAGVLLVVVVVVLAPPPSARATTETVEFVIAKDPSTGLYAVSPNSTHVPANSIVNVMVVNYDPVNHTVPVGFCNVTGTLNGTMMWSWMHGGMMGSGYGPGPGMMRNLTPAMVSHTFTIGGDGYGVNVPIPVAHSATDPSVVNFSFAVHGAGELPWMCEGASSAGTMGPMMGAFWVD
jgi:hypothetical protein